MTANPDRGEVDIVLGDATYPMRPSYEAAQAIEKSCGNIVHLFRRINGQGDGLTIGEMAIIVTECIRAAGRDRGEDGKLLAKFDQKKVAEMIYAHGLIDVFEQVIPLLGNMLSGGSKKKDTAPTRLNTAA